MSVRWSRKLADLAALTETLRHQYPRTPDAPNRDQWDAWWATADRVRKDLTVDGPELIRRAAETSVDGYGTQSGAVGTGSKGMVSRPTERLSLSKVASELACHDYTGDGRSACQRCGQDRGDHRELDPVRRNVLEMVHHTHAAVGFFRVAAGNVGVDDGEVLRYVDYGIRRLVKATAHRARALPPVPPPDTPDGKCRNCWRYGIGEPAHRFLSKRLGFAATKSDDGGRCRFCYEGRRRDGRDPNGEAVRVHHERRIDRELEKKAGGR